MQVPGLFPDRLNHSLQLHKIFGWYAHTWRTERSWFSPVFLNLGCGLESLGDLAKITDACRRNTSWRANVQRGYQHWAVGLICTKRKDLNCSHQNKKVTDMFISMIVVNVSQWYIGRNFALYILNIHTFCWSLYLSKTEENILVRDLCSLTFWINLSRSMSWVWFVLILQRGYSNWKPNLSSSFHTCFFLSAP